MKEILKDWPEVKQNGELAQVWLETGLMLSSAATNYSSLGAIPTCKGDFLLESDAFENNSDDDLSI